MHLINALNTHMAQKSFDPPHFELRMLSGGTTSHKKMAVTDA